MPASTTSTKMKVPFYGHARQYHNIKREIDDAFHAVTESEAYAKGPALARFEKELAQYFGMKHAVGLQFANGVRGIIECGAGAGRSGSRLLVAQKQNRRVRHRRFHRSPHRRWLASRH
jgi:hypothetical protein